jgi:predicted CxxxxCH...CXXCH cytochrome family protein
MKIKAILCLLIITAGIYAFVANGDEVKTDAASPAVGADGFRVPEQKKALGDAPPPPANVMTPLERVNSTPKGELKNPYANSADMPQWGQKRYMGNSCNGCHGGTGGGGMCPPISNDTWVYGSDDDTLFRLITLGSDGLQKNGYVRKGRENVVGPMPAFGQIIKTDDEVWRIISFLRTTYRGDPSRKNW